MKIWSLLSIILFSYDNYIKELLKWDKKFFIVIVYFVYIIQTFSCYFMSIQRLNRIFSSELKRFEHRKIRDKVYSIDYIKTYGLSHELL